MNVWWLRVKKYWWLVAGFLAAVVGFLFAVSARRPRVVAPHVPPRPELPDVTVPERPVVTTRPADAYRERAAAIDAEIRDRVAAANARYGK